MARIGEQEMNDWLGKNVASIIALISVLFGLVLLYLFATVKVDSSNEKVVLITIGILSGILTQVISFYFGSSSGSARKDAMMQKTLNGLTSTKKEEQS
jgi:hypothetical protein